MLLLAVVDRSGVTSVVGLFPVPVIAGDHVRDMERSSELRERERDCVGGIGGVAVNDEVRDAVGGSADTDSVPLVVFDVPNETLGFDGERVGTVDDGLRENEFVGDGVGGLGVTLRLGIDGLGRLRDSVREVLCVPSYESVLLAVCDGYVGDSCKVGIVLEREVVEVRDLAPVGVVDGVPFEELMENVCVLE